MATRTRDPHLLALRRLRERAARFAEDRAASRADLEEAGWLESLPRWQRHAAAVSPFDRAGARAFRQRQKNRRQP